jgi:hypothetical protein
LPSPSPRKGRDNEDRDINVAGVGRPGADIGRGGDVLHHAALLGHASDLTPEQTREELDGILLPEEPVEVAFKVIETQGESNRSMPRLDAEQLPRLCLE